MTLTYKEFMSLVEKYYGPHDTLPSGKTPYNKASDSLGRQQQKLMSTPAAQRTSQQARTFSTQADRLNKKVQYGADHKGFKDYDDNDVEVEADSEYLSVHHPKSGIKYTAAKVGKDKEGNDTHNVAWSHKGKYHSDKDSTDSKEEKLRALRSAQDVWNKHVSPRLPHNSTLVNSPSSNRNTRTGERRNTRSKLYQRAGFGELNTRNNEQFAKVGREPSPKQAAKGKTRLKPLSKDTQIDWDD